MTLHTETISPTRERLNKGDRIEPPCHDQRQKRAYHRSIHPFEDLYAKGRINEGCRRAGEKLVQTYYGALGINVSSGDGDHMGESLEYARSYHAQKLAEAEKYVKHPVRWKGLLSVAAEEQDLQAVGRGWMGVADKARAYIAGLALVRMGLEDLSVLWGFSDAFHKHRPPSR